MRSRRFAIGAEPQPEGTHFRVWAPAALRLEVVERAREHEGGGASHALARDEAGYFSGLVPALTSGMLYSFRIDEGDSLLPDPASRFQPRGPHGPSQIIDPAAYRWGDSTFRGARARGQVLYELHVGTFTREGTYAAAARELAELRELGVTTVELMPVAEFPGEFGWGYDGVDLWAPTRLYGEPDDLRRLVDTAHQLGLAVILDVVYNHFGPDGCYLKRFSTDYFTDRYANDWGESLNFDSKASGPVREFFIENARYWIAEYHFDGLRLDATQDIMDASERHVIADITRAARAAAQAQDKRIFIAAENEPQLARLVEDVDAGGYGCDALWNDDFHHTTHVALTGRREAYYQDYCGTPQELISAVRWGYLFQGQYYQWQDKRRGAPALTLDATRFISYLENHDQVANSLTGERLSALSDLALLRALTTFWLLSPPTPLLFQGQEFGASAPFLFFADHRGELRARVGSGRAQFLAQFPSVAARGSHELADPAARSTFERCKLDLGERTRHSALYALHKDLLALRRADPALQMHRADRLHGAVLSADAFLLRYMCEAGDRLLLVNLGRDLELRPAPEPLLAPPAESSWRVEFCSEDVKYGGKACRPCSDDGRWVLAARCATFLVAGADSAVARADDTRAGRSSRD